MLDTEERCLPYLPVPFRPLLCKEKQLKINTSITLQNYEQQEECVSHIKRDRQDQKHHSSLFIDVP
jgi:hypothetical protein